jgi:hypothetical protein
MKPTEVPVVPASILLGLLFYHEDGDMLLQNIGLSQDYMALQPRRPYPLTNAKLVKASALITNNCFQPVKSILLVTEMYRCRLATGTALFLPFERGSFMCIQIS